MPQRVFSTNTSPLPFLEGEKIIFSTKPHPLFALLLIILILIAGGITLFLLWISQIWLYTENLLPGWVLFVFIVGVFLFVSFLVFLYWLNTKYILTSQRVQIETGIIAKKTIGIALDNIQNLKSEISFWGRIFNFGTITIEPAGLETKIVFANIPNPKKRILEIRKAIP